MSNVRAYTDQQILDRLPICEGWNGMPEGIFDVWVRSNEDAYNKFDDKVYTFDNTTGTPKCVMVCTGTSNAGAEGLKRYDKYNREGCAILNGNQIVYGSHRPGLHKGKYPAYRQAKPFPYYRDGDKDNRAEELGDLHNDIIGANCHKAGWFSTEIGGWSVACLVRNQQAQYDKWLKFMAKRPLTVAILDEWIPEDNPFKDLADSEIDSAATSTATSVAANTTTNTATTPATTPLDSPPIDSVTVTAPEPYQGQGFIAVIKKDFAFATGGNLTFQGLSEYAQQASGWPEWLIAILTKVALVAVVLTIGWFLFRVVHYLVDSWKKDRKVQTEAAANTSKDRFNIEWS